VDRIFGRGTRSTAAGAAPAPASPGALRILLVEAQCESSMGDCGWSDYVAVGNNLADYQDQGGVVGAMLAGKRAS
jgi:hypothetical protein